MRVRKFSTHTIPAQNHAQSVRFYREVFDLPTEFGDREARTLSFQDEPIAVIPFTEDQAPITVTVVVRDHQETVQNHLLNYYVTQSSPMVLDPDNRHVHFFLDDPSGNHVEIIANK